MDRSTTFLPWGLFVSGVGFLLSLVACGSPETRKIQYVVVIVQENRTPDNLFHGLPNADIADSGVNSQGEIVPLTPVSLAGDYDLDHAYTDFINMYDHGKMDGADKIGWVCPSNVQLCEIPPNPQFKYVELSEVVPYLQLAERFTFADRMFQTNQGPSFPAHQFIISGTSAPTATSEFFAASNPNIPTNSNWPAGCTAPAHEIVAMVDPAGKLCCPIYPCFEHLTIMDLLDTGGISWRYYTPSAGSIWTAPNAVRHLRLGPDWANVVLQPAQILSDIATNRLPTVSWVIPTGQESDHAGSNEGTGPSWVASVVNAIGRSRYWPETAIFVFWDDWGGWYDHVAPKIYNSYEYGFRVPLIVVSPYAKQAYVSHVTHDFGSILKFIEENYNLPSLGYADARADDLSDCFDYYQTPVNFRPISTPVHILHFLEDKRPPIDPDDD